MKKLMFVIAMILVTVDYSNAQSGYTYVNGYYNQYSNTFINGHYRTTSNSTNWDNMSTRGNYNQFSGTSGSIAPDYSWGASNYGSGNTIYTGTRGGQYYYNSNGNKTYVPKRW